MPSPVSRGARLRLPIIAALLLLAAALPGCGVALKLGYDQGSPLAFRWLDGYVDFNDAQSLRVRGALDEWFAWHRRTQLPDYADLLARAGRDVLVDTTPARICAWADELRQRIDSAFEHARPALLDVAATLTPQQIANVEKKYGERNESFRDDYLQRDPARRREAAVEREIERAEKLYGALDDGQRERVASSVADSPFDAELAYAERLRRQQDALTLLRRWAAAGTSPADAQADLDGYLQRLDRSPNEDYRRYVVRLTQHNCAFAAALHNSTTSAQRSGAANRLAAYEGDLRSLAAAASK